LTINSVGAGLLMLSYEEAKAGTVQAAGSYSSTEGSRVLASFNVDSYPGERDRIKELGLDLATAGLLAATAKLGAGAVDKLGAKLEKWWVERMVKEVKGADVAVATGSPITTRFVNGVTVVDRQTGAVFNGTVDLQSTFDRIAAGATGLSKNDGSVFRNGQGLLPQKSPGYYTEYVVPTPGINGPGPQRIVTGQSGEMFYTPDHYRTFIPVKKP
jgi:guanyl-specific ribonuclease Sa